jgi:hypothetical protein
MHAHERALLALEQFPLSAAYRIAIGYAILPSFALVSGDRKFGWSLILWFVAVLLGLRLVPAALRKLLPFSQRLLVAWDAKRTTAKRFDSYQWRKLFWIGTGMAAYALPNDKLGGLVGALTLFCVASGAIGLVIYRRLGNAGATGGA